MYRDKSVLVVLANTTERFLLKRELELAGVKEVRWCVSAESAYKYLKDVVIDGGLPDIVVIDYELRVNGQSGYDLLVDINATPALRDLKTVLITSEKHHTKVAQQYASNIFIKTRPTDLIQCARRTLSLIL